jgi:hypothetical protein
MEHSYFLMCRIGFSDESEKEIYFPNIIDVNIYLCAGWICYAEKKLGSFVLPYISSVKSPQQTIGTIIKRYVCQDMELRL